MPRIRSTHFGQWSDEDFVAMSFPARLLALALRNIADDHGVFEWKPLTIKMQLMPADHVDIPALLAEMVENNIVLKFAIGRKQFGAIRNFMRWQRPKKPSYQHPISPEVLEYVSNKGSGDGNGPTSDDDGSEPVGNQFGTGSENAAQREEVIVGSKKEESCPKPTSGRISYPSDFEDAWKAYPTDKLMSKKDGFSAWRKLGSDDKALVFRSIPAFVAYCRADPSYRPLHFVRYITSRRFEGMADDSQPSPARPAANGRPARDADGNLTNAVLFGRA
jgi:hypothetical protein